MRVERIRNQTKKHVVHAWRTRLGPVGVLPDFLLIGVPRGGTTACFRQLVGHPQVGPPLEKEIRFFDLRWEEGERFYRRCFPTARRMSEHGWRITGEATPRYLQHPDAPARAASLVPDARLVVLLRDPVMRAWSHYLLYVDRGLETRSFDRAIREEIAQPIDPRRSRGPDYLGVGDYPSQLRRWFDHFPREHFLIIPSEDYFADGKTALARIQVHLAIAPLVPAVVAPDSSRRSGEGLDPATVELLREYFAPVVLETAALLGVELPWPSG